MDDEKDHKELAAGEKAYESQAQRPCPGNHDYAPLRSTPLPGNKRRDEFFCRRCAVIIVNVRKYSLDE